MYVVYDAHNKYNIYLPFEKLTAVLPNVSIEKPPTVTPAFISTSISHQ